MHVSLLLFLVRSCSFPSSPSSLASPRLLIVPLLQSAYDRLDAVNASVPSDWRLPLQQLFNLKFASPFAEFRPSQLGGSMIVHENTPAFVPRGILVLLVALQGVAALLWMASNSVRLRSLFPSSSSPSRPLRLPPPLPLELLSLQNVLLHTAHYAHNIARPVEYCEPEWLYRAYVFTEMEITGAFFTPLLAMAIRAYTLLLQLPQLDALPKASSSSSRSSLASIASVSSQLVRVCGAYLAASLLSGLHYAVEPPSSYAWPANVTISGSCVAAVAMFLVALHYQRRVAQTLSSRGHQGTAAGPAYATVNAAETEMQAR